MGRETGITWTHSTFNPWRGCQRVSPGCEHCYAETLSHRNPVLLGQWGPPTTGGTRIIASPNMWREPLKWNQKAMELDRAMALVGHGKRIEHRVFCSSLADVFEDLRELDLPREWLWALISATPHLTWQLLTKRPENVLEMVPRRWVEEPVTDRWNFGWPHNVWIGCTVEDQRRADERIPHLLRVPARVRFLSCEPLLEAVTLDGIGDHSDSPLTPIIDAVGLGGWLRGIQWVICGGESGHHARPFDLGWARSLRDQCRAAAVPFFMKQMGDNPVDRRMPIHGLSSAGSVPDEWPPEYRVQEVPA